MIKSNEINQEKKIFPSYSEYNEFVRFYNSVALYILAFIMQVWETHGDTITEHDLIFLERLLPDYDNYKTYDVENLKHEIKTIWYSILKCSENTTRTRVNPKAIPAKELIKKYFRSFLTI